MSAFISLPTSLGLAARKLRREWRAGEHVVLVLALLVAVGALTAVSFFTSRVDRSMAQRANEVLAADIRLQSSQPLNAEYLQHAQSLGLKTSEAQAFNSVIVLGDATSISSARAVTQGYPLRGKLKITDTLNGPAYETSDLPAAGEVWADPRLLSRLGAEVGMELQVGKRQLKVSKVLDYRPDQGSQFVELAPTLLMRVEDVESTGLIDVGSRVQYRQLFAGDLRQLNQFKYWLNMRLQPGERMEQLDDASPQLQSSIERAGRFLNLTGLTSVLLAGVAVAMAARRYVARHLDTVALMKSMGASQRMVLNISLLELGMLGVIAGVLGTALGYLAQWGLGYVARDLIDGVLPAPSWSPVILGMVTPVVVLAGFALPPLLQLKRVPPARVLRHNVMPPPLRYISVYGIAAASVYALLLGLVRDARLVNYVAAGTLATIAVLSLGGWLLVRSLGSLRRAVGVSWRYGVANIARRGSESVVQLVAFGMGLMVLLLLLVVRNDLLSDWRLSLPENAPNQFLINIAPDKTQELTKFFVDRGVTAPVLVPMLRARLQSINDTPANRLRPTEGEGGRGRGFLEREANLTWSRDMQEGNKLVAGEWWRDNDGGGPRVSVEVGIANSLGIKLGDRVTYDVGGETVTATVSSFREVRWDSFRPNFFMVFSPGVLDSVTGTYITSVHLDAAQKRIMGEFYRTFPEVTAIDIDALLTQIRSVMDNAAVAIQYVFGFSLLAGISVLLAAIQSTRDERRYESAMLRTLGASRRVVLQGVAAEFIVLGLLAGLLGACAASAVGYYLATEVFNLKYNFDLGVWLIGMIGGLLLVGVTGIAVTRSVVNHPPAATLREG
ncbi:MAG: FtsX-like permease family protein [Steroidobacteraceae bacterium]